MPKPALVILNISTLDFYADKAGLDEARELVSRMREKILLHDGPVYIVDQRWRFVEPISEPRRDLVHSIQLSRDINWIHYDEGWESWEEFLGSLVKTLKKDGVKNVVLGGLWYDPDRRIGAVSEAEKSFRDNNFTVRVAKDIVGEIP